MCVCFYVWEENRKNLGDNKKEKKMKENQETVEVDLETWEFVITAGGLWCPIDKKTLLFWTRYEKWGRVK